MPVPGSSGNTLRCLRNRAAERAAAPEEDGADAEEVFAVVSGLHTRRMMEGGGMEAGILPCSEAVGLMREIKPVRELVRGVVAQAE